MEPVRVIIADDHLMVREGLKSLLELDGKIKVVGQADDGIQCIKLINELNPDVTLLDISMPRMNGIQVLEKLQEMKKKPRVLMLTVNNRVEYLKKVMEIGASGYILKDSSVATLKKAIFTVFQDKVYIEPKLASLLQEKINSDPKPSDNMLTKREKEVLRLLAQGLFNKEIAIELGISEKTVKNHVSNILKKMEVCDRTQAAIYAVKNSFLYLV